MPCEFRCSDCGVYVYEFIADRPTEPPLCSTCLYVPGWQSNPQLRAIFDPGRGAARRPDPVTTAGDKETHPMGMRLIVTFEAIDVTDGHHHKVTADYDNVSYAGMQEAQNAVAKSLLAMGDARVAAAAKQPAAQG